MLGVDGLKEPDVIASRTGVPALSHNRGFYRIFYRMVQQVGVLGDIARHRSDPTYLVSGPMQHNLTVGDTAEGQLITRRSRVQIPPPPPRKSRSEAPDEKSGASLHPGLQPFCNPNSETVSFPEERCRLRRRLAEPGCGRTELARRRARRVRPPPRLASNALNREDSYERPMRPSRASGYCPRCRSGRGGSAGRGLTVGVRVMARPQSALCGQLSCVETSALLGHLFVLVLIPAFLAGLARRDVSLDGRSAAISRPIASPHGGVQ